MDLATFTTLLPGILLLAGQLCVFLSHLISDRKAVATAAELIQNPVTVASSSRTEHS